MLFSHLSWFSWAICCTNQNHKCSATPSITQPHQQRLCCPMSRANSLTWCYWGFETDIDACKWLQYDKGWQSYISYSKFWHTHAYYIYIYSMIYVYIYICVCIFRHILYVLREYFLQWNALQWNIKKPDSPAFTSYLQALHMCPTHPAISIPSGAESSASASIDSHHPPHHRFRRWRPRCGRERSFDTLGPSLKATQFSRSHP